MWQHGTWNGYNSHACRCDLCRKAGTEYKKQKAKYRERVIATKDEHECEHGTQDGYTNHGCRCDLCRLAYSAYQKSRRAGFLSGERKISEKCHGTMTGYLYRCKCDKCASFREEYNKSQRKPPKEIVHGRSGYRRGCRCDKCRSDINEYFREYHKTYPKSNNSRISHSLRCRLNTAIRGEYKSGSAVRDLGCSIGDLVKYLESQFSDGMSWDNYGVGVGKWNIDHIKPLCTFDLSDRDQFLEACHYTNLRPLWSLDNMKRPDDGSDLV